MIVLIFYSIYFFSIWCRFQFWLIVSITISLTIPTLIILFQFNFFLRDFNSFDFSMILVFDSLLLMVSNHITHHVVIDGGSRLIASLLVWKFWIEYGARHIYTWIFFACYNAIDFLLSSIFWIAIYLWLIAFFNGLRTYLLDCYLQYFPNETIIFYTL